MRKPAFTDTTQIAIVVSDVDAAIQTYANDYGIGPWQTYEINSNDVNELREDGQPVESSWRVAVTKIGQVQWELIQPLDEKSMHARFLAQKGAGVHHIALATPEFEDLVAMHADRGRELAGSGELGGVKVAYLPTDEDLGVIIEIASDVS
jgi:methylmalonyl-CoA/ethylmalonyl-CoA epimerase